MLDILTISAKLLLLYPWIYTALDAIVCKPYGSLSPWTISCTCLPMYWGETCANCLVPPEHGTCAEKAVSCIGLRKGSLCQTCMGKEVGNTCSSSCDNDRGYYTYQSTCRFCQDDTTCSGHGTCMPPDGTCRCDDGWAQSSVTAGKCGAQCKRGRDEDMIEKPCSGHGTCVEGGRCQCDAPYCGAACENALVHPDDLGGTATWCYGNGAPNLEVDGDCTCACKTDQYNTPAAIDAPGRNNFCKYQCPVGSGGHVCGATSGGAMVVDDTCSCSCGDTSVRSVSCDTDCAFGGTEDIMGNCNCLFENQEGGYPSFCRTCKTGYFIPELGCKKHCIDSLTCQMGFCAADSGNRLRVTCHGCSAHHRGDILPIVLRANTLNVLTSVDGTLNVSYAYTLTDEERRAAVVHPMPDQVPTSRFFRYSNDKLIVMLAHTDNATITVDSTDGSLGKPPYKLQPAVSFVATERLYGQVLDAPLEDAGVASTCQSLAPLCQGYTLDAGNELLYTSVSTSSTSGPPILSSALYVVASHAELPPQHGYSVSIMDTVLRGCSTCTDNYYPEPAITPFGAMSCDTFCDSATCHHRGSCTENGTCTCVFANMDATCSRCLPNFYPEPGFNVSIPCQQSCYADRVPQDAGIGFVLQNASTCSNHGVCDEQGHCRCSNTLNGQANGYSGDSCENACNKDHDSGLVCSGHGSCRAGQCAQCDAGYFGSQCEVTCSRDDQSFWRLQGSGRVLDADNNVACGQDETCSKLMCNGKANQCTRTYQYTHLNQSISYKICDVSTNATNKRKPLLECTGYTDATYPYSIDTGRKEVGQDHGIYCDVDISTDATDDTSRYGVCAQTVCRCRTMATAEVRDDVVNNLQVAIPLAGTACQYTGCERSQFSNVATWTSFCGEQPPPRVQAPSMYLYKYPDDIQRGMDLLREHVTMEPQECSHGTCMGSAGNNNFRGTKEYPAPTDVDGVRGQCACKQTPQPTGRSSFLDYRHQRVAVNCGSESGAKTPYWPDACCGKLDPSGTDPYFGHGCADRCMCNDAQHWKGTCAIDVGSSKTELGIGCNCRAGQHDSMAAGPRTRLFCGATCDTACKGIMSAEGKQIVNLRAKCPDVLATADSPAQQPGCYDGLLPCSGHGVCATSNGRCMFAPTFYGSGLADCSCWGNDVRITEFSTTYGLPGAVAMYGGDDCSVSCPGAHALDDFFEANYASLHTSYNLQETLDSKREFIIKYKQNICSGHGYCVPNTAVVNNSLACTCDGNWGGNLCDQKCELNAAYWTDHPFQEFENASDAVIDILAENFGLHVCGPHATCDSQACIKVPDHGEFVPFTEAQAKPIVAGWLDIAIDGAFFTRFWKQWSMAFVGAFSDCKTQYYSSAPIGYGTAEDSYIHALPQIVEWHLTRTCDTEYKAFAAHTAANTPTKPPWCCDSAAAEGKWHDDKFLVDFTHGGCPINSCTNFATGRQCDHCVSNAFSDYMPRGEAPCTSSTAKKPQPIGHCAVCKQDAEHNLMVYPYDVYDADNHFFDLECVPCFSNTHRLSGNQRFSQDASLVCNGHGTCEGRYQTFGGRMYGNEVQVSDTATSALLCDHQPRLGLCKCDSNFEGPTCAIPKTEAACNNHGVPAAGQCKCDNQHFGLYCQFGPDNSGAAAVANELEGCLQYEHIGDVGVLVECNDLSGKSKCITGLKCQSCPDPRLDENTGCREYKDIEVDVYVNTTVLPKRQPGACL